MQQHLAEICPDQFIQLLNRQKARGTLFRARRLQQRTLAVTGIVGMACIGHPSGACQVTQPTTDHRAQQILMFLVIATGNALIVLEFFLDHVKLLLAHNGRDLSDHNPIIYRHAIDTAVASPNRFERRNASGRRSIVIASCIHGYPYTPDLSKYDGWCHHSNGDCHGVLSLQAPADVWPGHGACVRLADSTQTSPPPLPLQPLPGVPRLDHVDEPGKSR